MMQTKLGGLDDGCAYDLASDVDRQELVEVLVGDAVPGGRSISSEVNRHDPLPSAIILGGD